MKKIKGIVIILLAAGTAVLLAAEPVIVTLAKKQLEHAIPGSRVTVGGVRLDMLKRVGLRNVSIEHNGGFACSVKEIGLAYEFRSLFKNPAAVLYADSVAIAIDAPEKNLLELFPQFTASPQGAALIRKAELNRLDLDVHTKDLQLVGARLTAKIDVAARSVISLDFSLDTLAASGVRAEGISAVFNNGRGQVNAGKIQYNKGVLTALQGSLTHKGQLVSFNNLTGDILGGKINADVYLTLQDPLRYKARLNCAGIDLRKLVNDFDLKEKVEIDGKVGGAIELEGEGSRLLAFQGGLNALNPGGILTIKDKKFLETIAANSRQSLDIVVDSFQDYRYTIGTMATSLQGDSLILDIALDGAKGKKHLTVALHNVSFKR